MGVLPVYANVEDLRPIKQVFKEWDSLSGMVASKNNVGVLWGINDGSGGPSTGGTKPEFSAVNRSGDTVGRYTFVVAGEGGGNEDIAVGPGPAAGHYLYLGPNMGGDVQTTGRICRIPEPSLLETDTGPNYHGTSGSAVAPGAETLDFTFGDGDAHTCEAFMLDPITKDLYIVTKGQQTETGNPNGMLKGGQVFKFPYPQSTSGNTSITMVAKLEIDTTQFTSPTLPVVHDSRTPARPMITGADISTDGQWIIIRTRSQDAWVWKRPSGGLIEDAWGSGAPSNRKGAGGLNVLVKDGQESCFFAAYKAKGFTVGNSTTDGTPGGIYGAREIGDRFWFNEETQQPDAGGPGPDSTGWLSGVPVR